MCKGQFGEYVYLFKPELSSKYFDVYFKWELHYFLNSGKTWQEKVKHVRVNILMCTLNGNYIIS